MENIQDIYPLSPMQEGMLFHSIYSEESGVYQEQFACKLIGDVRAELFKKSWEVILDRHDILRTAFVWEDVEEPLQIVHEQVELPFNYEDYSSKEKKSLNKYLEDLRNKLKATKLDFTSAPLMRINLIKLSDAEYYFIWDHHHILFDGWTLSLLMNEIIYVYNCLDNNKNINLPPVTPYKNYIAWIKEQDEYRTKEFWSNRLEGLFSTTNLYGSPLNNGVKEYNRKSFKLSNSLTASINEFINSNKITLNTFLQSAWALLLSYYTQENDIIFGATFSGRNAPIPGIENMIGLFINTLPIRVQVDKNKNIKNWLKEFQLQQSELQQFEYSPLFKIQKWADGNVNGSLFNNIFVFENYPKSEALEQSDSKIKISDVISVDSTNYPLTVVVSPSTQIVIEYAYDSPFFDNKSIERFNNRLKRIISEIINKSDLSLGEISYLTNEEKENLIKNASAAKDELTYNNICSWLDVIAANNLNKNALVCGEEIKTYNQIFNEVQNISRNILELGVNKGDRIALIAGRSIDMVVSLLGIIKVGATVVPIDKNYPIERIEYIIEDSKATLIIKDESIEHGSLDERRKIINLNSILKENNNKIQLPKVFPNDEAYLIYTSGSTGKPKGVCIEHQGVCSFVNSTITDFELGSDENIIQFASFGFDAAMGEIFSALLSGNTLFIPSREETLDEILLTNYINQNNITFAYFTPSYLSVVNPNKIETSLKIASVGDKCTPNLAKKWGERFVFFNGYGPTETSIGATFHRYNNTLYYRNTIPIGKPFKNVEVYILNNYLEPVDVGVPGEIYISGKGVGRGYNNDPARTAGYFIPNPYSSAGSRMYKSGDLGKLLPNGEIEFVGRVDNQVKIRGFRVELSEIEKQLNSISGIDDSVIKPIKNENGNEFLAAYIKKSIKNINENDIIEKLSKELPSYMIPRSITFMDSFPLTINNKINIDKLPTPDNNNIISKEFIKPSNPTEEILVNIWSDILNIESIGKNDNFFELGGHSLLATQLISRIRETFKKEIPFNLVFESKDLATTAKAIDDYSDEKSYLPRITKSEKKDDIPLSFSQQRLWFLDKLKPGDISYNIPTAIRIKGEIDFELFNKSINKIIAKHESLRTTFVEKGGKPFQKIYDEFKMDIVIEELNGNNESEKLADAKNRITAQINKPFDLNELPLLRVKLYRISESDIIFFLVAHHIICDGWSLTILIDEFIKAYKMLRNNDFIDDNLEIQFSDYAIWLSKFNESEEYKKQLSYWKNELKDAPPLLELPYDKPKPKIQSVNCDKVDLLIDAKLKNKLLRISRNDNATLFMILFSAFEILLSKYSNQNEVVVGTPIAGRELKETEPLIGFFVNNLAIRGKINAKESFRDFLIQIRDKTVSAYSNQTIPFDKIVEEIQPVRDLSHQPIFQVMFIYQNLIKTNNTLEDIDINEINIGNQTTNYDITFTLGENQNEIKGILEYNSDLFNYSSMERMVDHFNAILNQIATDPEVAIEDIEIINEVEKNFILNKINSEVEFLVDPKNVPLKFINTCKEHEKNIAIIYDDNKNVKKINYNEFDLKSNKLAQVLKENNISSEHRIGIYLERDINIIIAMFAILKSGAAFVPIDPSLPEERVNYILNDSSCSLLVVDSNTKSQADKLNIAKLEIDSINFDELPDEYDLSSTINNIDSDNLAYIIYTSGSTGKPKGVMLSHKGLINLAGVQQNAFNITEQSNVMQFSSISFDASVWEIVMALLNGATLYMTSKEVISSGYDLSNYLKRNNITTITLPPSVLSVLPKGNYESLQTLITAGEAVSNDLVNQWKNGRKFFNAYGPTETTVCATMLEVDKDYLKSPPIGYPISNFNVLILNSEYHMVGIGIPGELCVSGIGIARGYHNNPDLTAEKFIPNQYSNNPGDRLYRTGDLVRIIEDGKIEFLGRIDTQVKIRGFRIEIGEIENALKTISFIIDATVLVKTSGALKDKIIAYVVCDETSFNKNLIKEYLQKHLPDYMIPNSIVRLEALPLNTSGKIDKNKLPLPQLSRSDLSVDYVPPSNEKEKKLVKIVENLLKIDRVGVKDNFFELGGHSLLATQFISRIREEFDVELKLLKIFEDPSIEGVLRNIEKEIDSPKIERPKITRVSRESKRKRNTDLQ